jgi:hypothetical protein
VIRRTRDGREAKGLREVVALGKRCKQGHADEWVFHAYGGRIGGQMQPLYRCVACLAERGRREREQAKAKKFEREFEALL